MSQQLPINQPVSIGHPGTQGDTQPHVQLDVWSDYVCPFCYLEEPVLAKIQETYGGTVAVHWRAYELRPHPVPTLDPDGAYLHDIWQRAVYPMARECGLTLRLPPVQPRSRLALEATEFARDQGEAAAMHHALFQAFFEHGRDIGTIEVLIDIAPTIGVDAQRLQQALRTGQYTAQVLADERLAQELGITAVPTLVVRPTAAPFSQSIVLSGAQPYERVQSAIERVLAA